MKQLEILFYFISAFLLLQLFAHIQEVTLQQNHKGVAYTNLRLSRRVLLNYLLSS